MSTRYNYTVLIGGVNVTAVINKMGGPNAAKDYLEGELVLTPAPYLRRLFKFTLGDTDGKDTADTARLAFPGYFGDGLVKGRGSHFVTHGIVFSGVAPKMEIAADRLLRRGNIFSDYFGSTAAELEKWRLLGSQFLAICREHPKKLDAFCSNLFLLTSGDEKVAADLSNVFVAGVQVDSPEGLATFLGEFRGGYMWNQGRGHRVFSPLTN